MWIFSPLQKKNLLELVYGVNGKDRTKFQSALADWKGDEFVETYGYMLYHSKSLYNKVHFESSIVDEKLEKLSGEKNIDLMKGISYVIEGQIVNNFSALPLCFVQPIVVSAANIKGLKVNLDGSVDLKEAWTSN